MRYLFVLIALVSVLFPSIVLADDECEEGNQNVTVTVKIITKGSNINCYGCSGSGFGSYYINPCKPPIISNLMVTNIDYESAVISWATDKRCKGRVWFAEYANYEDMQYTSWDEGNLLYHEFVLSDLNDNTRYAYQAIVEDECGIRRSDVLKFKTEKYVKPIDKSSSETVNPSNWSDELGDNNINSIISQLDNNNSGSTKTFNWILLYWILGGIAAIALLYLLGWSIFKVYNKTKQKPS